MTNPWNLQPLHGYMMDAIIAADGQSTNKHLARRFGITLKQVEHALTLIYKAMGARCRVEAALLWDRWRRGQGEQP